MSRHKWLEGEKADLLALSEDDFLMKYPYIGSEPRRVALIRERARVQAAAPIEMGDGFFHAEPWSYEPRRPAILADAERHVMIGDTHGMYVNQKVWATVLDFIRDFKPHQINMLGDIVDFYDISRFDKDPNRRMVLGQEVAFTDEVILSEVRRAAPKAAIYWKGGNHEERLQKYLWTRAPELASLRGLDMRELFRLRQHNIEYVGPDQDLSIGNVTLTHGHLVRKHSGWTAKAMLEDLGTSVIHNHTHRLGAMYKTDRSGSYIAFENGCLCVFDMGYLNGTPNWQSGFSVGWKLPNGQFHFEQIAIRGGGFFFGGKFFGTADPIDHCHD